MDWTHSKLENPDVSIHETDFIADEAMDAFRRRRETYPDHVKAGTITQADARADLAAWREIAKDWRWIAYGDGEPAGPDTLELRIQALDNAIERLLAASQRNYGQFTERQARQGALICAMRWWAERERTHPPICHVRAKAARGHDWRRENGHPTRGQIITARQQEFEARKQAEAEHRARRQRKAA